MRQRNEAHAELLAQRRAAGGPITELARENEVFRRYGDAFGSKGTALALLLIELGSRAQAPQVRIPGQQRHSPRLAPAD
ncbi:chorismate mutase family protein [Streptomyces erythrochromogenes]|uniref:hypothetical protein n=1 Tax=Streptomyces erythrochromogenes TaxID=285574 RepID=UPI003699F295